MLRVTIFLASQQTKIDTRSFFCKDSISIYFEKRLRHQTINSALTLFRCVWGGGQVLPREEAKYRQRRNPIARYV